MAEVINLSVSMKGTIFPYDDEDGCVLVVYI